MKLSWRNNQHLSSLSHDDFFDQYIQRAREHNHKFFATLQKDKEFAHAVINLERLTEKDPKRYNTWVDVEPAVGPAFPSIFDTIVMPSIP